MDFCVLHLCFQSVDTAPKLDSEKNGVCIGIYSVFRGVRVVGGVTMYIYIYIHAYMYIYMYIYIYVCIFVCVRIYMFVYIYIYIYIHIILLAAS